MEKYYEGKNPHWEYTDLSWGMRDETEFIISSAIDFTLGGELIMKALLMEVYKALVMEVYRLDAGCWKLARQYMEKYRPEDTEEIDSK